MYIKIGSPKMDVLFDEEYDFKIGRGVVMEDGNDVTIIGTGTVVAGCQCPGCRTEIGSQPVNHSTFV